MEGQERTKVDVAKVVGVDDHNLVGIGSEVGIGSDRAGRAQQRRLIRFDQAEPALGVDPCDIGSNLFGQGVSIHAGLADSRLDQAIDPDIE